MQYETMNPSHAVQISALSKEWETAGITYGLLADPVAYITQTLSPYCFIARESDDIIGFVRAVLHNNNEACVFPQGCSYVEVTDLYVPPTHRSQGIGQKLLKYCERQARQDGIDYFTLTSATKDAEAIRRFYTANGYKIWSTQFFKRLDE